jgi:hypothetical protein
MANLSALLGGGQVSKNTRSFFVFNTGLAASNGGCCCAISVPIGFTRAYVEIWGGGGGGGGSCCCQWPYVGASSGSYVQSKFTIAAGDTLTVCAGGSTACANSCCGCCGQPSFVLRNGNQCACVTGGAAGATNCFVWSFSCAGTCVPSCVAASTNIGCVQVCSARGIAHSAACGADMYEISVGTPKYGQNMLGTVPCQHSFASFGCSHYPTVWPSGTGASAGACGGGFCWSSWGAAGLVIINLV